MNSSVIVVLILLLILFGMVAAFFVMRPKNVPTSEEEETTSEEEETIVIGGKETYITMPSAEVVPMSFSEYPVYVYDRDSTRANSAEFWDKNNNECPGGGFDCVYSEKVVDGRVVAITDKDGNDFIQQFVDDLYAGKLSLIDEMLEEKESFLRTNKLSEDNKLMRKVGEEWKVITPNLEETTASKGGGKETFMMPVGQYLLLTMLLYKMSGKPKPKVVIDLPAKKRKAPLPSKTLSAETSGKAGKAVSAEISGKAGKAGKAVSAETSGKTGKAVSAQISGKTGSA
jgi:hypothetical protein